MKKIKQEVNYNIKTIDNLELSEMPLTSLSPTNPISKKSPLKGKKRMIFSRSRKSLLCRNTRINALLSIVEDN